MKKLLLILIFSVNFAYGQHFQIQKISNNTDDEEYSKEFPILSSAVNEKVAEKINLTLQHICLGTFIQDNIGEKVLEDLVDQNGYGVWRISYDIIRNDNHFFSIVFHRTEMRNRQTWYKQAYVFDSQTGELLNLSDLFTKNGVKWLFDQVQTIYTKKAIEYLRREDRVSEVIRKHFLILIDDITEETGYDNFYVDSVNLVLDRYTTKNTSSYTIEAENTPENLINWVVEIPIKSIPIENISKKKLNIPNNKESLSKSKEFNGRKFYTGKIDGKYAIFMKIDNRCSLFGSASYMYTKYGNAIELRTEVKGGYLKLYEGENTYFQIELTKENKLGKATWINNNKVYPVTLY